ncbi:MAG: hypothetical protein IPM52_13320 [Bacteroidetes bacterium]|nr:hypothetical protein [Bacteroidota bacterium]
MNANAKQKRILHALLAKRGLMDMKAELVLTHTGGRTQRSSQMSQQEIAGLINSLQQGFADQQPYEAAKRMKRRIYSLCYSLGWTVPDHQAARLVVDNARLDGWMLKYGYLHKPLRHYKSAELPKLLTQFERFVKSTLL